MRATIQDIAAGRAYVIGTHFCFPPMYVNSSTVQRGYKTAPETRWGWTDGLLHAECYGSKETAERGLASSEVKALVASLDDSVKPTVQVLKVQLKVVPVA